MGTTTNNGWPTPVATDLVKDGWEAIKDLGDAIDTTLGVYSPTTSGLVLLNTTSFSAVASQSINDVFSATYDYYKIIFNATKSTSNHITMRLRVAGADESASNYGNVWVYVSNVTLGQYQVNTTQFSFTSASSASQSTVVDVINPFSSSQNTIVMGQTLTGVYATQPEIASTFGRYSANTSYTGLTLLASTGNITGSVSVFGYNK